MEVHALCSNIKVVRYGFVLETLCVCYRFRVQHEEDLMRRIGGEELGRWRW